MDCKCSKENNQQAEHKGVNIDELVEATQRFLKSASDPFTAVIKFLADRPENSPLPGGIVETVLEKTFGNEGPPALIKIISSHVREISRRKNVIDIVKVHPTVDTWGDITIKQNDRIKFDVADDRGNLTLNNIQGLVGVEHGVELPIEKILVRSPNLIVTVKLGILHPQRTVAI